MKIGILTFHWAHNYGAVLQAYALYTYLARQGHDVEIINYIPAWCQEAQAYPFPRTPGILISNIDRYWRSRVFRSFQRKHLRISDHRYHYGETISGYDAVIVGSDQVFNPDIIAPHGQLDDTYLLASVAKGTRKIAYAASFGNSTLHAQFVPRFRELLSEFSAISVREESGCAIIKEMGLSGIAVPDPTILLGEFPGADVYRAYEDDYVLGFFLESNDPKKETLRIVSSITNHVMRFNVNLKQSFFGQRGFHHLSPLKWIQYISGSQFVLTDSYHSTIFSILCHRPFISIGVSWGTNWQERTLTLLNRLDMKDRFLAEPDPVHILNLLNKTICWNMVDGRIKEWRQKGVGYFESSLKNI